MTTVSRPSVANEPSTQPLGSAGYHACVASVVARSAFLFGCLRVTGYRSELTHRAVMHFEMRFSKLAGRDVVLSLE